MSQQNDPQPQGDGPNPLVKQLMIWGGIFLALLLVVTMFSNAGSAPGTDLSRASFAPGTIPAAKVFLGPLSSGHAEIHTRRGNRLTLDWPSEVFPYAGIWITRGFWKGLHHWAIEPTNAPVDFLSDIRSPGPLSLLQPGECRVWRLTLALLSS